MFLNFNKFVNEYINKIEFDDDNNLLEGAAYGHLQHPFHDLELTFDDLYDMIDITVKGAFTEDNFVQSKTDGQNLLITWKDGKLLAARNKSHLKNAGKNALDRNAINKMFDGRGEIQDAFTMAMEDVSNAIDKISNDDKIRLFDEGRKFASLEVITPITQNTVPYGQQLLIFHGIIEFDDNGERVSEDDKRAGIELGKLIDKANANIQNHFYVRGPENLKVTPFKDTDKKLELYKNELNLIKNEFNLNDNNTIEDYIIIKSIDILKNNAIDNNIELNLDDDSLKNLAIRFAGINKSYRIPQIKKDLGDSFSWYQDLEKNKQKDIIKRLYEPLESLFIKIGTEVMRNVQTSLAANPTKAAEEMRNEIEKTIKDVQDGDDMDDIKKLELELKRLSVAGGLDSIIPSEGVTFVYKGKLYKYTGIFMVLHQIRSILAFKDNRGGKK